MPIGLLPALKCWKISCKFGSPTMNLLMDVVSLGPIIPIKTALWCMKPKMINFPGIKLPGWCCTCDAVNWPQYQIGFIAWYCYWEEPIPSNNQTPLWLVLLHMHRQWGKEVLNDSINAVSEVCPPWWEIFLLVEQSHDWNKWQCQILSLGKYCKHLVQLVHKQYQTFNVQNGVK